MKRTLLFAATVASLALIGLAGVGQAQEVDRFQTATTASPSQSMNQIQQERRFDIFGLPVGTTSPVAPPYANSAYENFAGQPATGNATLAQTVPQTYWRYGRAFTSP